MAVLPYIFLIPKMLASNGILSIQGDVNKTYNYNNENAQLASLTEVMV
jgi:chromosome condensin MukBEF MukE localization factor